MKVCSFCGKENPADYLECELCHKKFPLKRPKLKSEEPIRLIANALFSTLILLPLTFVIWWGMAVKAGYEPWDALKEGWFWLVYSGYWVAGMVIDWAFDTQDERSEQLAYDPALNYDKSVISKTGSAVTAARITMMPWHVVRTSWLKLFRVLTRD